MESWSLQAYPIFTGKTLGMNNLSELFMIFEICFQDEGCPTLIHVVYHNSLGYLKEGWKTLNSRGLRRKLFGKKKSVMQIKIQGKESLSEFGSLICHGTTLERGHLMEYYSAVKKND